MHMEYEAMRDAQQNLQGDEHPTLPQTPHTCCPLWSHRVDGKEECQPVDPVIDQRLTLGTTS